MALQEPVNGEPKRWDKNYWLVFVDTDDAPIRVLATSEEDAKDIVQEYLIKQGRGELNVGDVGLVRIVEEVKGNEEYWGPTLYLERQPDGSVRGPHVGDLERWPDGSVRGPLVIEMTDYERLERMHVLLQEVTPPDDDLAEDLMDELFTHVEVLREKAIDAPWNANELKG